MKTPAERSVIGGALQTLRLWIGSRRKKDQSPTGGSCVGLFEGVVESGATPAAGRLQMDAQQSKPPRKHSLNESDALTIRFV